jgi:hypothetical protein
MNADFLLVDYLQIFYRVKCYPPLNARFIIYWLKEIIVNNSDREVKADVVEANLISRRKSSFIDCNANVWLLAIY